MTYVKDYTERFPDSGEPAEEKEYIVNGWMPVMVQMSVYGTNEDEAIKEAKQQLKQNRYKVVDRDTSELIDIELEEI